MGACCCRRRSSVETQTLFVGNVHDCTPMDAINEDPIHHCHDDFARMPSNLNPKTLTPIDPLKNSKLQVNQPMSSFINTEVLEQGFLDEHNHYREIHGCPPLILNDSLSILAQEWAQILAYKNTMQYRSDPKFGENIYMMCNNEPIEPIEIMKDWYDEIQYYKFNEDIRSQNTAHFTQIIWKNTKELGIGIEQNDNTIWIVAFYTPPGNYLRQFNENVPPPPPHGIKIMLK